MYVTGACMFSLHLVLLFSRSLLILTSYIEACCLGMQHVCIFYIPEWYHVGSNVDKNETQPFIRVGHYNWPY